MDYGDLLRPVYRVREEQIPKVEGTDYISRQIRTKKITALITSLAVAIGLWGGVKAESVVLGVNPEPVEEDKAIPATYPAATDTRRLDNESAREMFTAEKRELRRIVDAAYAREERRERLAIAQAKADASAEAAKVARDEAIRIAVREEHAAKKATQKVEPKVVVSRDDRPESPSQVFSATSYIALCDSGCTGITATGVDVRGTNYHAGHRVIAVDPSVIPLGSIVRVGTGSGSFSAIAADTGGAIKGHKIDILVSTTKEALAFGRQNVSIQIIRRGAK